MVTSAGQDSVYDVGRFLSGAADAELVDATSTNSSLSSNAANVEDGTTPTAASANAPVLTTAGVGGGVDDVDDTTGVILLALISGAVLGVIVMLVRKRVYRHLTLAAEQAGISTAAAKIRDSVITTSKQKVASSEGEFTSADPPTTVGTEDVALDLLEEDAHIVKLGETSSVESETVNLSIATSDVHDLRLADESSEVCEKNDSMFGRQKKTSFMDRVEKAAYAEQGRRCYSLDDHDQALGETTHHIGGGGGDADPGPGEVEETRRLWKSTTSKKKRAPVKGKGLRTPSQAEFFTADPAAGGADADRVSPIVNRCATSSQSHIANKQHMASNPVIKVAPAKVKVVSRHSTVVPHSSMGLDPEAMRKKSSEDHFPAQQVVGHVHAFLDRVSQTVEERGVGSTADLQMIFQQLQEEHQEMPQCPQGGLPADPRGRAAAEVGGDQTLDKKDFPVLGDPREQDEPCPDPERFHLPQLEPDVAQLDSTALIQEQDNALIQDSRAALLTAFAHDYLHSNLIWNAIQNLHAPEQQVPAVKQYVVVDVPAVKQKSASSRSQTVAPATTKNVKSSGSGAAASKERERQPRPKTSRTRTNVENSTPGVGPFRERAGEPAGAARASTEHQLSTEGGVARFLCAPSAKCDDITDESAAVVAPPGTKLKPTTKRRTTAILSKAKKTSASATTTAAASPSPSALESRLAPCCAPEGAGADLVGDTAATARTEKRALLLPEGETSAPAAGGQKAQKAPPPLSSRKFSLKAKQDSSAGGATWGCDNIWIQPVKRPRRSEK